MKAGDMYYVGSMGAKGNYCGWPVLIISVNLTGGCYGLINGQLRWYSQKGLKRHAE